jgi:hypothetical protein
MKLRPLLARVAIGSSHAPGAPCYIDDTAPARLNGVCKDMPLFVNDLSALSWQ